MNIPVVIIHIGYKDYLKTNLEITGKNNKIFLIGDNTVKCLENINNVTFIDINKYIHHPTILNYKKFFVNYSSNGYGIEWLCFSRIFILNLFLKEFNIDSIFHLDSDNILLKNINDYIFKKPIAYSLNINWHQNRMSNSIHNGLVNINFCDKFINLYENIYVNKTKHYLIENKIKYHTDLNGNFVKGGICDMTLYYLLQNEKIIEVDNLSFPKKINDEEYVFINNLNNGEGYESREQYLLENNKIKIYSQNNKNLIYDKINKKYYNLFNIHFQGGAKQYLNDNLKSILYY